MKKSLLLFTCLVGLGGPIYPQSLQAQCHPSVDLSTMNSNFLGFLEKQAQKEKNKIAILPLFDNTIGDQDPSLFYGLPFLIYDQFSSGYDGFIHPYISMAAVAELGLAGDQLAVKTSAQKMAKRLNARFVIFGSFQRTFHRSLRVVVNIYDADSDLTLSPAENFESNTDDSFFDMMANHVVKAFARTKGIKPLKPSADKTPNMQAFRHLSKGLELAARYNLTNLHLASLWFEKGLKESFQRYDNATLHLARANFMIALIQKLNKMDSSLNWQAAQNTLNYLTDRPATLPPKYLLTFRFLTAHTLTLKAATAYTAGNMSLAHKTAAAGLDLVPEDGLLQFIYLKSSAGKKDNNITLNNPVCFQI